MKWEVYLLFKLQPAASGQVDLPW